MSISLMFWELRFCFQPAAEIIDFRIGELRGLSKWRARYKGIGLDEKLMDNATEKAGMLLVQVERFIRVLASVVQQVNFYFTTRTIFSSIFCVKNQIWFILPVRDCIWSAVLLSLLFKIFRRKCFLFSMKCCYFI